MVSPAALDAQRGRGAGPAASARDAAALDVTGYWVSVITEDWKFRMVTPKKGVYEALTLNAEGRRIGDTWDPARDEAAGEACRAYGAANIMRVPGRLHITWADANTLRIDTDAGMQTRLFHFADVPPAAAPSWQGHSVAQWRYAPGARGSARTGSLKVVTTMLRPGPHRLLNHAVTLSWPAIATAPDTTNSDVTRAVLPASDPTIVCACSGSAR